MPINIDNGLPAVATRFGVSDEKEMNFNVHLDSCIGLHIGNLNVHKQVITTYPYIVKNYIEFDDNDKFEPLGINCDVDNVNEVENNVGKLTAIVTYYTLYTSVNKLSILLSFGLGNEVVVNAIIGKPTLKVCKGCVDFNNDTFISEEIMLQFDMEYKVADPGLPKNVIFDSTGCVRPRTIFQTGAHIVSTDRGNNSATKKIESEIIAATISSTHVERCFTRSITTSKALWLGYKHSVTCRLLEFQPSQNTVMRGSRLLINIHPKVW